MPRAHRKMCPQCHQRAASRRLYVGWPNPPQFSTLTLDLCGSCWRSLTDILCPLGVVRISDPPPWVQVALPLPR
jgi:hypothetical protein